MKKFLLFVLISLIVFSYGYSQNVGIGTTTPSPSAILDVKSNTKGMLLPRTSTTSRNAIVNPAKGLILYDTTTSGFWFHNGTAWAQLSGAGNGWSLTGNAGTNPATNFIGTADNQPLRFRVNNAWAGEIHPSNGNAFFGLAAGNASTTGRSNVAIGDSSLLANSAGSYNTGIGAYSLYSNTTGNSNTANGTSALGSNTTGSDNTANGYASLVSNTTGSQNTSNGFFSLYSNVTGTRNIGVGNYSLFNNTSGSNNCSTGYSSLYFNTTGYNNTATGSNSLSGNVTGYENTSDGYNALSYNTTGAANTALGAYAMNSNTGGLQNTATGYYSLYANTSGNYNTANGIFSLDNNTTGSYNTAMGYGALAFSTGGAKNIAIGYAAGIDPNTPNIYNTVSIGNDGLLNAYQNQVIIGNGSTGFIGGVVPWSVVSDARVKNTIVEDVKGLNFILRLRPVTYHLSTDAIANISGSKKTPDFPGKYDGEKIKYTGFLAQEVEQAAKAANYDFSGWSAPKNQWGLYTVSYEQFVVPLVKAMQEQQVIITNQQKQIDLLEKRLNALEAKL